MGEKTANFFSLFLVVADFQNLPCGWRRHARFCLTVVNQISDKLSLHRGQFHNAFGQKKVRVFVFVLSYINFIFSWSSETERWFDEKIPVHGYEEMISLAKLNVRKGGFLVKNEVKIVVEVDVLQVIGNLDVSEVSSHLHKETSSVDVNGFLVLPSQVTSSQRFKLFYRYEFYTLFIIFYNFRWNLRNLYSKDTQTWHWSSEQRTNM